MENEITFSEVVGFDDDGKPATGDTFVVKKEDMRQLNDPDCEHEWEPDPSEDTDFVYGIKCKNCPIGKLILREK